MKKKRLDYKTDDNIYSIDDVDAVMLSMGDLPTVANNKSERFYNIACSFDIEVSSFYRDTDGATYNYRQSQQIDQSKQKLEKCSCMYVWQFGINGSVFMGRTWKEFLQLTERLMSLMRLSENQRLICYVHNLSYEFQFIRNLFEWVRVFSIDLRKPIYAITKGGIEFRCSYLLSGYSLSKLGEQLTKYKCMKLVGDLDYSLLRHSRTELTEQEIGYCVNDVKVVMNYIQERIEEYKSILRLPLTKTGFVRKFCRKHCLYTTKDGKQRQNYKYRGLMNSLTISGLEEFDMLQRAFAGGFTHANANYTNETVTDVDSYDFTSSYPYVMVSEKFPMSKGVPIECKSLKQFDFLTARYCCIFDVEFTDIFASKTQDNPISVSKCFLKEGVVDNNGRLVCAKRVILTITDVDYSVIRNFYSWGSIRIGKMYCYRKDYLPPEFVKAILDLYEKKTTLKGVEGKETEYLNSKEMLNSCYGMCVTNPLRDEFEYDEDWHERKLTHSEKIDMLHTYNTNFNRFLFYPWGVFVTAYARRNLFAAIYAIGDDYIYSDTDSVKIKNGDDHKKYFSAYNNTVDNKLRKACKFHGIDITKCMPDTIKGITKILGVWDYEGRYKRFKTLGAKRYMVETTDGKVSLTVSGVNKKTAVPYLVESYGTKKVFDKFTNYLTLPPCATGKNIHTYIDYKQSGILTDYKGEVCEFEENSGIHLEPSGYSLSMSVMYLNYLLGIKLKD